MKYNEPANIGLELCFDDNGERNGNFRVVVYDNESSAKVPPVMNIAESDSLNSLANWVHSSLIGYTLVYPNQTPVEVADTLSLAENLEIHATRIEAL